MLALLRRLAQRLRRQRTCGDMAAHKASFFCALAHALGEQAQTVTVDMVDSPWCGTWTACPTCAPAFREVLHALCTSRLASDAMSRSPGVFAPTEVAALAIAEYRTLIGDRVPNEYAVGFPSATWEPLTFLHLAFAADADSQGGARAPSIAGGDAR